MATTATTGANVHSTGSSTQQQQRSASLGSARSKLPLFDTARRVWCQSPLPHYVLEHQRYVQPARCIPLVRPGRDLIVLPGGHEPTRKMWEFNKELLGLSDEQVIWTQGSLYNMDKDMDALTLVDLKRRILKQSAAASAASASTASAAAGDSHSESEQEHWLLVPYAPQAEFERWARPLLESLGDGRASVFGETEAWLRQFGDKGLLHRHMDRLDEPSEIEKIDPTISVPRGYVCETTEHLLAARELLNDTECCIKPLAGATGVGIVLCPTNDFLESYDFPLGAVNLEELLELDTDGNGEAVSPAVHYLGGQTVGEYMLDQIMSGCEYTGWQRTVVSPAFVDEASRAMSSFLRVAQPQGAGGVDFLSAGGKPFLTDVNSGRFNGAHAPRLFFEMHAPAGAEFYCSKKTLRPSIDLPTCWRLLCDAGLAFVPSAQEGQSSSVEGVFPVLFLQGIKVQLLVIGKDPAAVNRLWCETSIVLDSSPELAQTGLKNTLGNGANNALLATSATAASRAVVGGGENLSEICAICLATPESPVELSCGHMFCGRCLLTAHQQHHRRCPVCRQEHVLDPIALRDKMIAYRNAYADWRKGKSKGAHGEPDIISRVTPAAAASTAAITAGGQQEQLVDEDEKKKECCA